MIYSELENSLKARCGMLVRREREGVVAPQKNGGRRVDEKKKTVGTDFQIVREEGVRVCRKSHRRTVRSVQTTIVL